MLRRPTCADQNSIAKFPPMKWRNRILFFCALILPLIAWGQDAESEAVRPSGIAPGPVRKARAVTAKDKEDADVSPSPVQKAAASKSTRARSHRTHAKPKEKPESTPAPTEYTPDGIPKTGAASVIVVDRSEERRVGKEWRSRRRK